MEVACVVRMECVGHLGVRIDKVAHRHEIHGQAVAAQKRNVGRGIGVIRRRPCGVPVVYLTKHAACKHLRCTQLHDGVQGTDSQNGD